MVHDFKHMIFFIEFFISFRLKKKEKKACFTKLVERALASMVYNGALKKRYFSLSLSSRSLCVSPDCFKGELLNCTESKYVVETEKTHGILKERERDAR